MDETKLRDHRSNLERDLLLTREKLRQAEQLVVNFREAEQRLSGGILALDAVLAPGAAVGAIVEPPATPPENRAARRRKHAQ